MSDWQQLTILVALFLLLFVTMGKFIDPMQASTNRAEALVQVYHD